MTQGKAPEAVPSQADDALARALSLVRSLLPRGSILSIGAPADRSDRCYWACTERGGTKLLFHPEDLRLGRDLLRMLGHHHEVSPRKPPVALAVFIPGDSPWPLIGASGDLSFIWTNSSSKHLLFCFDRKSAEAIAVIKAAAHPRAIPGLLRELRRLEDFQASGLCVAPRPIAAGGEFPDGSGPAATAQEFVAGTRIFVTAACDLDRIVRWLDGLRLVGRTVTMTALANRLRERIAAAPVESWEPILRLLVRVDGRDELPAAILHGDFRPANLLVERAGRLVGLDWEFSASPSLVGLDFARYVLEEGYGNPRVRSFEALFRPDRLARLRGYLPRFFPQRAPSLERFLALHFCHHYVDRRLAFGRGRVGRLERLEAIAGSPWPAGLDGA